MLVSVAFPSVTENRHLRYGGFGANTNVMETLLEVALPLMVPKSVPSENSNDHSPVRSPLGASVKSASRVPGPAKLSSSDPDHDPEIVRGGFFLSGDAALSP